MRCSLMAPDHNLRFEKLQNAVSVDEIEQCFQVGASIKVSSQISFLGLSGARFDDAGCQLADDGCLKTRLNPKRQDRVRVGSGTTHN